ncbi:MAG TPA: hypothetical protein VEA92_00550 [Candidatus Paceibacterota bacterium]|nr:hypothetical protein [Candidatus Paceibacterota bacterium]
MRVSRFKGWLGKAGVAFATAAVLVSGFAFLPSASQAQTALPTWPSFPKEQARPNAVGFTQQQFEAVLCNTPNDEPNCTHQGLELGTNPAVTITSICTYRVTNRDSLENCRVTFSDNRYTLWFEDDLASQKIVAEVVLPDGTEIGRQSDIANVTVTEVPDGNGGTQSVQQVDGAAGTDSCSLIGGNLSDCLGSIIGKLGASVLWILVSVLGALLGVFGMLFNWIVLVTVFQYSTYFGNSPGLLVAWSVLRDLGNILLLFGFIFIGIQTILNVGHFSVGKALPRLLIFAILINFSLLVSSAIVDVANVFSAAFYTEAGNVNCGGDAGTIASGGTPAECVGDGISGKILAAAGMGSIFSFEGFRSLGAIWTATDGLGMLLTYTGLLILIIVMMVVFIAASIMLIIRAVTLMFLLVISPLGFAATAIPQFEEYSKMWWNKLISQAFFAPLFLLMLFVGLKIMEGAQSTFNTTGASLVQAFAAGGAGTGGIFILFFLIIGFMVGSLMIASSLGAMGASFATSKASGVVMGGMGFVGRRTAGRAMYKQADKLRHTEFGRSGLGKMVVGGLDSGAKSSFDPRASKIVSGAAGAAHLKLGDAKKGGYAGIVHHAEEEREKYSKDLKNTAEETTIIKEIDTQIATKKQKDAEVLNDMDVRHRSERTPIRDEIKEREKEAADARARGNQAAVSAAETAISNLNEKYKRLTEEQNKERAAEEARQKQWIAGQEAAKKDLKSAPQRVYAERMGEMPGKEGGLVNATAKFAYGQTIGPDADHHAKEKIIKNINKGEIEKLADALKAQQKNGASGDSHGAAKKDDGHGGGH